MIWMISGLHDPRWLSNILDNYNRQTYRFKRLIIVENGNGIGISKTIFLPKNIIVLQSDTGPAQVMNAGINYLKSKNKLDDWFCKCDSDDYYGPNYLKQISLAKKSGADYAGRNHLYIRSMSGKLWYLENNEVSEGMFHGPTQAAKVKTTLDYPLVNDWGEDLLWCENMLKAGKKPYTIIPEGFCYQRWSEYNHTWPCTDIELRTSWSIPVIDLGKFNLDIVNGTVIRPQGIALEIPDSSNFMPFRIMRERSLSCVGMGL